MVPSVATEGAPTGAGGTASRRPVIHVGYPKTGTTTLQRSYFANVPGYTLLTAEQPRTGSIYARLSESLRNAPDHDFLEATTRAFLTEVAPDGRLLWSDERLTGDIWDAGLAPERVADRLHRLLPEAAILVSVRHQGTLLASLYSRYVKQGGYVRFADFVAGRAPGFAVDLDRLAYDRLVARYQELFGDDRVVVVAYEQWRSDPHHFWQSVADLLDAPPPAGLDPVSLPTMNRSLSYPSRWVLRHSNRWFRKSVFNPRPRIVSLRRAARLREQLERIDKKLIPGVSTRLAPADLEAVDAILSRFEAGNERLARSTGLPLAELGYPAPRHGTGR
jgi:hypothetical protein